MSDSDDSDDSGRAFDVEIEKCEKRLQLARYKKKYRNVWDYVTNRWQDDHVHIVLKDLEQKWRVYSAGSHEQLQNVSDAFRYLEQISPLSFHRVQNVDYLKIHPWLLSDSTKCDYEELKFMALKLNEAMMKCSPRFSQESEPFTLTFK